jgi:hypothetical protein
VEVSQLAGLILIKRHPDYHNWQATRALVSKA